MRNLKRNQGGFSLVEMMIALFVGALLIMISYSVLTSQKKAADAQNQLVNAQQNARVALETLEKELRLAGLNIDDFNGQPIFIDAAPYQVIFNSDISGGVMGVPGMTINQTVPLSDGSYYSPGMLPGENIGALERYNNNAETVRYTLDDDDNGVVNSSDRYGVTDNPNDYAVYREENGKKKDIIAYGIRGRENYPDGQIPHPLFKYYGDFNDDGTIILWGDSNDDDVLSQAEIATITSVPQNLLAKIIEVEIVVEAESGMMEAGYSGPHGSPSHPRQYRSVVMTSKVRPRNVGTGSANLHACGLPPASPTSLGAADTPADAGESITLDFNSSYDEMYGEEDVFSYTVYRRVDGGQWECVGSITPNGSNSYNWEDGIHTLLGGPEIGVSYYYLVTAWDCRPQESNPSNMAGPVQALPNGPDPPSIVQAYDTPCDDIDEITVAIHKSPDDIGSSAVSRYEIYRGINEGGGILSKVLVGKLSADGSEYYTYLDNETYNLALDPPEAGHYYYYIARAIGGTEDSIPSINSNEYGGVYYSGTISACQLTAVEDYPDDEGEILVIRWNKSPSEDCGDEDVVKYEIRRKSIYEPYAVIDEVSATHSPQYFYVDDGLTRGNEYTYCIWTIGASEEAVPSNEKSGVPLRNTEVDPPENLAAEDILCDATGAINVTWEHSPQDIPASGRITHYFIYRRQEFTSASMVGFAEADGSETYAYVDGPETNPTSPPVIGEYYYYSATAYDEGHARESTQSNEDNTMSDGEPGAPRITEAYDTPLDAGRSITVSFDRSADDGHCSNNVIIYLIFRETEEEGTFDHQVGELTATGALSYTHYDDEIFSFDPPVDGIGYYYAVRARESDGRESINSNVVGPVYSISQDPGSYIVFEDDFETDKGWVHGYTRRQDDWQRGTPGGKGGDQYGNDDPTSAHSGANCYGNDLGVGSWNGRYQNNVNNYLITPEGDVDCFGHANVVLQFHRWLNVEAPAYDQAEIFISTNGHDGPWTEIWQNESEITDSEWVFMEIDISQWADGESNVAIRWRLRSDGGHAYAGWNIDDVLIREAPQVP